MHLHRRAQARQGRRRGSRRAGAERSEGSLDGAEHGGSFVAARGGGYSGVMRWLQEPSPDDPTWARDGESQLEWLRRSTLPGARAAREFLNAQLAKLPAPIAEHLRRRLELHWDSSFFELIVGRTLQELGAKLELEMVNAEGYRPDYRAGFDDGVVIVEAVSPQYDLEMGRGWNRAQALLPFVREALPPQWAVLLGELPELGPSDSKQAFKRAFRASIPKDSPADADDWRDVEMELDCGRLDLTFVPRSADGEAILAGPVLDGWDDSEARIRLAVRRKRRQVRSETHPVLLAVAGRGAFASLDRFDQALFCRGCTVVSFPGRKTHNELRWDGLFMKPGRESPTYAGVLAFPKVGYRYGGDPVLYVHPRFDGALPKAFGMLEWRVASRPRGIDVRASRSPEFLRSLEFVADDV